MPSPTICCVRSRRPSARALIEPFSEALELRTALNTAFETDRRSREGDRNAPLLPSPLLKTLECTRSPNFLTASQDDRGIHPSAFIFRLILPSSSFIVHRSSFIVYLYALG